MIACPARPLSFGTNGAALRGEDGAMPTTGRFAVGPRRKMVDTA
jgi:hypothetical protein